jgi:hypothetical protein
MNGFEHSDDYQRFAYSVRRSYRYRLSDESEQFLKVVGESSNVRKQVLPVRTTLFRAQRGGVEVAYFGDASSAALDAWEKDLIRVIPYPVERMLPRKTKAPEGRVNPKGIPCLYLATDDQTAGSEVRPFNGSHVTIALCETREELSLVDLSKQSTVPDVKWGKEVWSIIDRAFSMPVADTDDTADYVPTQIVAELFRRNGYDGIAYTSNVGRGKNVALFKLDQIEIMMVGISRVKAVSYEFEVPRENEWDRRTEPNFRRLTSRDS